MRTSIDRWSDAAYQWHESRGCYNRRTIGGATVERLRGGAAAMGIELGNVQIGQFQTYLEMLTEWNERAGLTSSSALAAAETRHFLDSLTVSLAMRCALSRGASFVDVGSGAGFPGVPLKIAFANLEGHLSGGDGQESRVPGSSPAPAGRERPGCHDRKGRDAGAPARSQRGLRLRRGEGGSRRGDAGGAHAPILPDGRPGRTTEGAGRRRRPGAPGGERSPRWEGP